jgi:xylulose-5-phosphate/fructose-6-phosphate phosphoketolase
MAASDSTHEASHFDSVLSANGTARLTIKGKPLSPDELLKIDAYWQASLYVCMGMLYVKASLAARTLEPGANEAAASRSLGLRPRPVLHLHSLQSACK